MKECFWEKVSKLGMDDRRNTNTNSNANSKGWYSKMGVLHLHFYMRLYLKEKALSLRDRTPNIKL